MSSGTGGPMAESAEAAGGVATSEGRKAARGASGVALRRGAELLLFLGASAIGIYGLGRAIPGLFEPGQGIDVTWLAATGVALLVLSAQMGRVHDSWPRRREGHARRPASETAAPARPGLHEESEST